MTAEPVLYLLGIPLLLVALFCVWMLIVFFTTEQSALPGDDPKDDDSSLT